MSGWNDFYALMVLTRKRKQRFILYHTLCFGFLGRSFCSFGFKPKISKCANVISLMFYVGVKIGKLWLFFWICWKGCKEVYQKSWKFLHTVQRDKLRHNSFTFTLINFFFETLKLLEAYLVFVKYFFANFEANRAVGNSEEKYGNLKKIRDRKS
jgi:hypothetical protein